MSPMTASLTLDTGIGPLNSGLKQSKNILLGSSDLIRNTTKTFNELEILDLTLGWLCVGNYPMAYSGLKALINKPAFGWACGAYVAWTGDDYILNELDLQIKKWRHELEQDTSFSTIYKNLGSRALIAAYHSRRDANSAQRFEQHIGGEEFSYDDCKIQRLDAQVSILPETPEQLATILGFRYQRENDLNPDQLFGFCRRLNRRLVDSVKLKQKGSTNHLFLASLLTTCFLYGLAGIVPDVPSGRVTLSPNIPDDLSYFKIENLPLGQDTMDFSYKKKESECAFVFEQKRGRVPLNLVFQPILSGKKICQIYIDEELADLEWHTHLETSRVSTQVQLYLEKQRQVTIIST